MRSAEYIKRIIANAKIKINPEVKHAALNELVNELEQNRDSAKPKPDTWRIFMNNKIKKLAVAAIIIFIVVIGINQFNNNNVAFADVIGYLQKNSYTFDLKGPGMSTIYAMVWELGRMRIDTSLIETGDISSITDFNTGQTVLMFHKDQTAVLKNEPALNKRTGAESIVSLCTRPITELWNILDGSEESLGEVEGVNGKHFSGFKIVKKDDNFEYDIIIIADTKSGMPHTVKVDAKQLDNPDFIITWTMENFDLDVHLDEELFSLDLLPGYTWAYQENLKSLEVETSLTPEAEKFLRVLDLASEGKEDEAIQLLLLIDWNKPIKFDKEPYIFSVSEKGYISLKAEDQKLVDEEASEMMSLFRKIMFRILEIGQIAVSDRQYDKAEIYFNTGLELGKLLEQNPDYMLMVRLLGISIEKRVLNTMIEFYNTISNQEKVQMTQNLLTIAEEKVNKVRQETQELNR